MSESIINMATVHALVITIVSIISIAAEDSVQILYNDYRKFAEVPLIHPELFTNVIRAILLKELQIGNGYK